MRSSGGGAWANLEETDLQESSTWRSGARSAMRAASQLPGKGPTDVDDAPASARYSKIWLWYMMSVDSDQTRSSLI